VLPFAFIGMSASSAIAAPLPPLPAPAVLKTIGVFFLILSLLCLAGGGATIVFFSVLSAARVQSAQCGWQGGVQ